MQDILDRAIGEEEKRAFFEQANASYARLKADEVEELRSELAAWDVTLLDGLDPEPRGRARAARKRNA